MSNKQTAVEWLVEQYANENYSVEVYEQAKAMEKERIREAYYKGVKDEWEGAGRDFEDFYNETYGDAND
jgi:hypothetical protein